MLGLTMHLQVAFVVGALRGALHTQLHIQGQRHAMRRHAQARSDSQEVSALRRVKVGAVDDDVAACRQRKQRRHCSEGRRVSAQELRTQNKYNVQAQAPHTRLNGTFSRQNENS